MNRKKDVILRATVALTENYKKEELFMPKNNRELPSRAAVIDVVKELRSVIFPGYFWNDSAAKVFPEYFAGYRLNDLYDRLKEQIEIALLYAQPELEQEGAEEEADRICAGFFEQLPEVQQRLLKDVQRDSTVIRLPRAKKKLYHLILVCLPFMYIAWLIFYIKKKFRIFRES